MKKFLIFAVLLFVSGFLSADTQQSTFPDPQKFPLPSGYQHNVNFWEKVYSEWHDDQMVIHDSLYMQVVFEVHDFPDENSMLRSAARTALGERVKELRRILLDLHNDPSSASKSSDHKKVYQLYSSIRDPEKFRKASENIRVQQGIRDRFEKGLSQMTRYIDQIKKVFREERIPEEIAYLPLVESSFNNQSLSKTRAAGIWQFMPGTAKLYMKLNQDLDERLDPFVASRSAARYLKRSYEMFGNWPVSLTSYNHGQQGMRNAIKQVGTSDFMTIVTRYQGKYFGFASRNFYAEFLAACRVMHNREKHFPDLDYEDPLVHDSIRLSTPLWVSSVTANSSLTREDIRTYNPALQSSVLFSKRPIPAGYEFRIPSGRYKDLDQFIAQVRGKKEPREASFTAPATSVSDSPVSAGSSSSKKNYVVRRGDTLFAIARKFSTTVDKIRNVNRLQHSMIVPGQRLVIPTR